MKPIPEVTIRPPIRGSNETPNVFNAVKVRFGEEVEWHYDYDAQGKKYVTGYTVKGRRK